MSRYIFTMARLPFTTAAAILDKLYCPDRLFSEVALLKVASEASDCSHVTDKVPADIRPHFWNKVSTIRCFFSRGRDDVQHLVVNE